MVLLRSSFEGGFYDLRNHCDDLNLFKTSRMWMSHSPCFHTNNLCLWAWLLVTTSIGYPEFQNCLMHSCFHAVMVELFVVFFSVSFWPCLVYWWRTTIEVWISRVHEKYSSKWNRCGMGWVRPICSTSEYHKWELSNPGSMQSQSMQTRGSMLSEWRHILLWLH